MEEKRYEDSEPLTSLEWFGMARYVAIKLLKKPTKHSQLKIKHQFFVQVLRGMQANDLSGDVDTLSDYTRLYVNRSKRHK